MDLNQRSIELIDKLHADILRAIDEGHPGHAKALVRILVDHACGLREHAEFGNGNAESYRRRMRTVQDYGLVVGLSLLAVAATVFYRMWG